MAVKNPIGIDANGDLYEMDATDLATKNPICLYSGELKELQSGDTLPGGGGGGGGTDPIIREYIANATWTKPAGLYAITVICVGAGGGGGSGRRGTGTERKGGGNGGGGGGYGKRYIKAADLGATESIVIGAGGTGGAAQTADSTNGNQGTDGGTTEFGSGLCKGEGGEGGVGGTTDATTSGVDTLGGNVYPSYLPRGFVGSGGGKGAGRVPASRRQGGSGGLSAGGSGGGAGGGYDRTTKVNPGQGGGQFAWPSASETAGAAVPAAVDGTNGNPGADDVNTYITDDIDTPLTIGMGTGASGGRVGNTAGTIAGGDGANGGKAAGGSGGGASWNGANSGAGGNGGNGFCVVIEFYGA